MTIKILGIKKKRFVKKLKRVIDKKIIFEEVDVKKEKIQNIGYRHESSQIIANETMQHKR